MNRTSSTTVRAPSARASGRRRHGEPRWLGEVRLRAGRRVAWTRHRWQSHAYAEEHVLAITHSEVDRALEPPDRVRVAERTFMRGDVVVRALTDRLGELEPQGGDAAFADLVDRLELTPSESALLALAAAAAVEPALTRVFGYLLDLTHPAHPTPALAAALYELAEEPPPPPGGALRRWQLAEPAPSSEGGWRVDETLLPALTAAGRGDWSVGSRGRRVTPPPQPVLAATTVEAIIEFVNRLGGDGGGPAIEIELVGEPGSGRTTAAARAATALGRPAVAVGMPDVIARDDPAGALVREARRARLEGALPIWCDADGETGRLRRLPPAAGVRFVTVRAPDASPATAGLVRRSFACPPIGRRERIELWTSLTPRAVPVPVAEWALRPAEVAATAAASPAGDDAVAEVARGFLTAVRGELLNPLPLPFLWTDIVLAPATRAHLGELEAQARHRGEVLDEWGLARLTPLGRGTTALFSGPSGTGKTMAAQVLARELGLELLRVDLAGVVNKYVGETEKHLRELFDMCERAPVLLLFDEADALFGKRGEVNDAHDRYANIEIDYLLARMERFNGLAVLTTNRRGDLDSAFVRRLRFVVEFAPPGAEERARLWRHALASAVDDGGRPLAEPIDWDAVGRELDLTGAGITSAALAAAFLARAEGMRIGERHVLAAARRELEKQGIVVRPGQLESRT